MNRIQLACYCLIASAIVTTALICSRASNLIDSPALAEMSVHKDMLTMISTKSQRAIDAEIIYVLDSKSEHLMAYQLDFNRKSIDLLAAMDLAAEFGRKNPVVGKDKPGR